MNSLSLENLQSIDPIEFENLVKTLLIKMGFHAVTTKASGDGGIDILATNEQPIIGGKYVVQCKRYATGNNIGEPIIRELFGVMHAENANKGILITTSEFSKQAIAFAQNKAIELINGASLLVLINKHFDNLSEDNAFDLSIEDEYVAEGDLKNEPSDFRGITWGSLRSNHGDLIFIREGGMGGSICNRISDSKKYGFATIETPLYFFDQKDRFYSVHIDYSGKDNYEAILSYLFKNHGKPYDLGDYSHIWTSQTIKIFLFYTVDSSRGTVTFDYIPIDQEVLEAQRQKVAIEKQNKKSQCFVATVIYESLYAKEVIFLRQWRDQYLINYWLGRQIIKFYYRIGPSIAECVANKWLLKKVLKWILDMVVELLQKNKHTEKEDGIKKVN